MNDQTRQAIDKRVSRVLKDAGFREPPIKIEDILACLEVNRDYYDLEDPSLLQRFFHKIKVGGKKLKRLTEKIHLAAIWLPDEEKILIAKSLPPIKQDWASFHDTTHTILKWHRHFFLGDTAQTLDPDFQEMLESEANYGASALMFGGKMFTKDALDTLPVWSSIEILQKRYKKSLLTTLRRYTEFSHNIPMAMMVSTPSWLEMPLDQPYRWRHWIPSTSFINKYGSIDPNYLLRQIDTNIIKKKGGIVGNFECNIKDLNGYPHGFHVECF